MKITQSSLSLWIAIAAVACGRSATLETRTFELRHLEPWEVEALLKPYVWTDRPGAPGQLSIADGRAVTVRETPDNLRKIASLLAEQDRPQLGVRLHFQIIQANGASSADPAIAEVEAALRQLFRFRGYRLLAEAVMGGTQRSEIRQTIGPYSITAAVGEIRGSVDSGTVRVRAVLREVDHGLVLETSVNLRTGQTAVLGNTQLSAGRGTIILTVRPELVQN